MFGLRRLVVYNEGGVCLDAERKKKEK